MKTSDFDYALPPELIAQAPAPERAAARMLVVRRAGGDFEHRRVADLPEFLQPGDLLVLNDTRVIPARIFGRKEKTGGRVEVLLIEERQAIPCSGRSLERHAVLRTAAPPDQQDAVLRTAAPPDQQDVVLRTAATSENRGAENIWEVMLKSSRPTPAGSFLELAAGLIRAEVLAQLGNGRALLRLTHDRPLMEILEQEGVAPLPPYIKRPPGAGPAVRAADGAMRAADGAGRATDGAGRATDGAGRATDRERYQTVYARVPGAIAAPTAGLHFTPDLLERLTQRGVGHACVTLHVGPGTFLPVATETVEEHRIEPERYAVPAEAARRIVEAQERKGRIVAVGSTVVRTLETVAAERGGVVPAEGRSGLFIYPPYRFRVIRALLTNFHLPQSSLLMMVSAFAGPELIRRAYAAAIRERYRFYSYGDCMLIL